MIRDITIGQYYPAQSALHRLDPRVKIVGTFVYIISLFLIQSISGFLLVTAALFGVMRCSGVPFRFMIRGLRAILVILLLTVSFNLFLTPGEPLVSFWIFKISAEGIRIAAFMAVRLIYLILGSSLMTFTTTPNQLTDALEKLLRPLGALNVPVHEVAMMMSIALRFIPILLEETDKIMKAQMARGASFDSGNMIRRAKSMVPILVPLFVSAFRRANDLAMAMEARCYRGGAGRTKMKPLMYNRRDYLAYGIMAVYFAAVVLVGKFLPF